MDKEKNIQELKDIAEKFCVERDWEKYHNAKDLAIGISTEASEILEHFRFKNEKEIEEMFKNIEKKKKISDELADTFYFLLRMSKKYDIDLSEALEQKMKENEKKYPVEKVKGLNKKYNEY